MFGRDLVVCGALRLGLRLGKISGRFRTSEAVFRSEEEKHASLGVEPSSQRDIESIESQGLCLAFTRGVLQVFVVNPVIEGKVHDPTLHD